MSDPVNLSPRLSNRQRFAVDMLRRANCTPGVVTSGPTALLDGQPWINWRTAYSLHDKGVVIIANYGDESAEVHLAT